VSPREDEEIDVIPYRQNPREKRVLAEVRRGDVRVFAWGATEAEAVGIVRQAIRDGAFR
jgi:hypothetical protein